MNHLERSHPLSRKHIRINFKDLLKNEQISRFRGQDDVVGSIRSVDRCSRIISGDRICLHSYSSINERTKRIRATYRNVLYFCTNSLDFLWLRNEKDANDEQSFPRSHFAFVEHREWIPIFRSVILHETRWEGQAHWSNTRPSSPLPPHREENCDNGTNQLSQNRFPPTRDEHEVTSHRRHPHTKRQTSISHLHNLLQVRSFDPTSIVNRKRIWERGSFNSFNSSSSSQQFQFGERYSRSSKHEWWSWHSILWLSSSSISVALSSTERTDQLSNESKTIQSFSKVLVNQMDRSVSISSSGIIWNWKELRISIIPHPQTIEETRQWQLNRKLR